MFFDAILRGPPHQGFHRRALHVPQRASGETLRHRRRDRAGLPRVDCTRRSAAAYWARQRAGGVELSDADVGGDFRGRQLHPAEHLGTPPRRRRQTCRRSTSRPWARRCRCDSRWKPRTNSICASCHSRLDPLGFALETTTPSEMADEGRATSRWIRAASCPDGKLLHAAEMRTILNERIDEFLAHADGEDARYSLAGGSSGKTVRQSGRSTRAGDHRATACQTLVRDVVDSLPFQSRRAEAPRTAVVAAK